MKIKTLINDSNFKIIFKYKNIAVYGKFIDIFIDNKVYEIKSLPILLQKYNIETIITNSVGSFFLIEKNKQNTIIYNSFGNSSLFFQIKKNSILLDNSEKKFLDKKNQYNFKNYIFFIKSHRHIGLNPFKDITFKNNRLPSGYSCTINSSNINYLSIIKKNNYLYLDNNENYLKILTKILKIYKKRYKNLELAISGGMDSVVLFLILAKNKTNFSTYFSMGYGEPIPDSISNLMINYLCKKYKKKNILKKPISKDFEYFKKELKHHYSFHFMKNQINKNLFLTKKNFIVGQNLDTLYYNDTFAPNTWIINLRKIFIILKTSHLRFISTNFFFNILSFLAKIRKKFNLRNNLISQLSYISKSPNEHEPIFLNKKNFKQYNRMQFFFNPLLKTLNLKKKSTFTPIELSQFVKDIKWLRFVINTRLLYSNYETFSKVRVLTPYSEGPMVNFFYNYKLSLKEVFFIKDLQNYVFKKYENNSFWTTQIILKLKYKFKNIFKKKNNHKQEVQKTPEKNLRYMDKLKFNNKNIKYLNKSLIKFCKNENEVLRLKNLLMFLDK